jgi:hypothetical protein
VRQEEPYKVSNGRSPRYLEGGPDILCRVNEILENARQHQQAAAQRIREQSALGSRRAPSTPSQSLDGLLQEMQRRQDPQFRGR